MKQTTSANYGMGELDPAELHVYRIVIKDGEEIPDSFDDEVELYNEQGERIYLPPCEPDPVYPDKDDE